MRLVERPRPKPTVRIPQPSADDDFPELADFPTDIPVNPSGTPLEKRLPAAETDPLMPPEMTPLPPEATPPKLHDSETSGTETE
jgi:hypothetical protein